MLRTGKIAAPPLGVLAVLLVLAVVAVGAPFAVPGYQALNLSQAIVFAIAILGLSVLTGHSGQVTLGHGAFLAFGAYASAIAQQKMGINYLLSIPLAGLVCGLLGAAFGFPALRLQGIYLALATFALAIAVPIVLKKPEGLTGGTRGILLVTVTSPVVFLTDDQFFYLVCLVVAAACFLLTWNVLRGRTGRAFRAIRDGDIAAVSFGVNIAVYKTLAFAIAAFLAGIAGALYALAAGDLTPDLFGFQLSVLLLVGAVIGGLGTLEGAVIGGLFTQFLPQFSQEALKPISPGFATAAPPVTQGVLLLLVMLVAKDGISGLLRRTARRAREVTRRRGDGPPGTPPHDTPEADPSN